LVGLVAAKDPACQLNECIEYQVIVYAIMAPTTSSTTPLSPLKEARVPHKPL
jgi:hypothetical protein